MSEIKFFKSTLEMFEALKEGKRITHSNWQADDYIFLNKDNILITSTTNYGSVCLPHDFGNMYIVTEKVKIDCWVSIYPFDHAVFKSVKHNCSAAIYHSEGDARVHRREGFGSVVKAQLVFER